MSSVSGLRTSQSALGTVSHNIANADTEGYSRQMVRLGASSPTRVMGKGTGGLVGQGVEVQSVERARARFMEAQVIRDQMSNGYFQGRSAPLDSFELAFDNGTETTIGDRMDAFNSALTALSQNPSSNSARNEVIETSTMLTASFRNLVHDISEQRRQIDDVVEHKVEHVNSILDRVADLNVRVAGTRTTGGNASDYEDKRDLLLRELAGLVDIRYHAQPNGVVHVETCTGFALVRDDQSASLRTVPNAQNGGLVDIIHTSLNGTETNVTFELQEGELAGLLHCRDDIMGTRIEELDQLAFEFASDFNTVHQAGFGLDGVDARDFFTQPLIVNGAASSLEVDAGILADPTTIGAATDALLLPGDNRNLMALTQLQEQRSAALNNQSYNEFFSEVLRSVGSAVDANRTSAEFATLRLAQSETMRESVVGVSVDDELVDLTRYQKHFQANTRVLETTNRLLDDLMRLVG